MATEPEHSRHAGLGLLVFFVLGVGQFVWWVDSDVDEPYPSVILPGFAGAPGTLQEPLKPSYVFRDSRGVEFVAERVDIFGSETRSQGFRMAAQLERFSGTADEWNWIQQAGSRGGLFDCIESFSVLGIGESDTRVINQLERSCPR